MTILIYSLKGLMMMSRFKSLMIRAMMISTYSLKILKTILRFRLSMISSSTLKTMNIFLSLKTMMSSFRLSMMKMMIISTSLMKMTTMKIVKKKNSLIRLINSFRWQTKRFKHCSRVIVNIGVHSAEQ